MGEANFYYFTCLKNLFRDFVTLKKTFKNVCRFVLDGRPRHFFLHDEGSLVEGQNLHQGAHEFDGTPQPHQQRHRRRQGRRHRRRRRQQRRRRCHQKAQGRQQAWLKHDVGDVEEGSSRRHQVGRQQRLRLQQNQEARRHEESLRHSAQPKAQSRQEDQEGLNAKKKLVELLPYRGFWEKMLFFTYDSTIYVKKKQF